MVGFRDELETEEDTWFLFISLLIVGKCLIIRNIHWKYWYLALRLIICDFMGILPYFDYQNIKGCWCLRNIFKHKSEERITGSKKNPVKTETLMQVVV